VGNASRGIRIWRWRSGDVGGRESLSKAFYKNGVNWGRETGKTLGWVTRGGESDGGVGVGVTMEVGSAWVKLSFKFVKMEVERREKSWGRVTRGGEYEYGAGVGVTMEVGSAWVKTFVKM